MEAPAPDFPWEEVKPCSFTSQASPLPPGFYLISPSEFERFSLSTKWLIEPRCLVDPAETKNHSQPCNSSGTKRASGQARWVKE